jgi:hypothetical protein
MDGISHNVLKGEEAGLPIEGDRLWRRASKDPTLKTCQPAAANVCPGQESTDPVSRKPIRVNDEARRNSFENRL